MLREMSANRELLKWLRNACADYKFGPRAIYRRALDEKWPLKAQSEDELEGELERRGHLMPLPKEPAALANVVEVSVVDYLVKQLKTEPGAEVTRGSERGYPDLEVFGKRFGGGYHAVDIKVARRAKSGNQTKSRITLYTGNTYFLYPELDWPLTMRPFADYKSHIDVVILYTFVPDSLSRIADLELIVQEPWRIASRQRSSTTREYIGAVTSIEHLRQGKGEFASEEDFYAYWRKFPFNIGPAVKNQLRKLLAERKKKGN